MAEKKVCLTIAGLDPSGGAGIIADIKTFSAFGCFAAAAISSLTFQNTTGVFGAEHQTGETVRKQVAAVMDDFEIAAVKTGMLPTREVIEAVADTIRERKAGNIVVDPVVRSTSGFDLIDDKALGALIELLFPLSLVVTPNTQEAERISGMVIHSPEHIAEAAKVILSMGPRSVLMKGGHFIDGQKATDYLFFADGTSCKFEADLIDSNATHGTGCTLAAAITANLALGKELSEAVAIAKNFVTEAIRTAPKLGRGHSPINIPRVAAAFGQQTGKLAE
ncbi:MAG: bifunctional hydroxymethylpyrimidine kinase/phosphomethylpyrimidine kinase [Acidobacteria bacterium]|nr:bifunctional hydroxymethylpyrimidine kinase/phosphomethylpyrimidine kinase [Acidobacteriota bacterium]